MRRRSFAFAMSVLGRRRPASRRGPRGVAGEVMKTFESPRQKDPKRSGVLRALEDHLGAPGVFGGSDFPRSICFTHRPRLLLTPPPLPRTRRPDVPPLRR